MSAENRDLITRVAEAICSGRLQGCQDDFTACPHWYIGGDHLLSGDHEGFDELCRVASSLAVACRGTYQAEFQKAIADDNHGYALVKAKAQRSGQEIKSWFLLGFRIKDGKVDAIWTFPYDQSVEARMFAGASDNAKLTLAV